MNVKERVKALAMEKSKEQSYEEWKEARRAVGRKRKAEEDDKGGGDRNYSTKKSHLKLLTVPEGGTQMKGPNISILPF